ncbi:DNA methyltransferase [Flavobacterium sp. N2820]|uniref:DNA methyltransferase n=1 Tax=Flavobacterium sp. N2820 TaxID=2986834 RepID=UPI0022253E90|nr:DNA methyltransferase [Flavobacterium sp. N2820]
MIEPISLAYNLDCIIGMKQYPDLYFDYAIVDIEYCIGASKPTLKPKFVRQSNGSKISIKQNNYKHSDWDFKKSSEEYFKELFRISKNQIIFGGNYYGLEGGYLVWDKLNGATDQFGCELAWLSFTKRTDIVYYLWSGMMQGIYCGKDVRKALIQQGNKQLNEKRIHETQKPIKIYDWILNEYVEPGSKVIDTHLGSGSNRISNYWFGNEFHSFEIDKEKFDAQEKRFQIEISQKRFF